MGLILLFFVDHRGHGKAYEAYGISPEAGAIVVVRPDQCGSSFSRFRPTSTDRPSFPPDVALICALEDTQLLDEYFAQFMLPSKAGSPASAVELVAQPDFSKVANQVVSHSHAVEA